MEPKTWQGHPDSVMLKQLEPSLLSNCRIEIPASVSVTEAPAGILLPIPSRSSTDTVVVASQNLEAGRGK